MKMVPNSVSINYKDGMKWCTFITDHYTCILAVKAHWQCDPLWILLTSLQTTNIMTTEITSTAFKSVNSHQTVGISSCLAGSHCFSCQPSAPQYPYPIGMHWTAFCFSWYVHAILLLGTGRSNQILIHTAIWS